MILKIMECYPGDLIKVVFRKHPDIIPSVGIVVCRDEFSKKIEVLNLNEDGTVVSRLKGQSHSYRTLSYYYQNQEEDYLINLFSIQGGNMKNVWEILVIDKEKNEIICKEIVIDGDEKSACSKVSIAFSEKLKNFIFENLIYITKNIGSY